MIGLGSLKFIVPLVLLGCGAAAVALYVMKTRRRHLPIQRTKTLYTPPTDSVRKVVLDNGMRIVVFKNPVVPSVLVQIAFDVGSYVEESGERGLAHLLEHMIFKGTEKLSETDIDTIARKYGASFNAFTSRDVTSYYFETNKNNWKPFVPLLADCMQNSRFDAEHLASEVKAVMQELRMGRDNFTQRMLHKALELLFPANHPYHMPLIGYKEDLLSMSAQHLKEFYKKYYRPDRATLFLIGDVDIDDAVQYAQAQFKDIKAEGPVVRREFPTLIPELEAHTSRIYEDVKSPQYCYYWAIPGTKSTDELTVSVLEAILGFGQAGRLHRVLVDEKKVATSVSVAAVKFMEAGVFLVLVEPHEGNAEMCASLVKDEIEKIIKDGVHVDEIERIAKNVNRSFFETLQDFNKFSYSWINSYFSTGDEMRIFKRVNEFYDVTSSALQAFAKVHLDPFLMNSIEVLPLPDAKRSHKESIKKASQELDQKILARYQRKSPIEEPRAALTTPAPESLAFTFPKPEKVIELANGLKVILMTKRDTPLVSLACAFKDSSYLSETKDGILLDIAMDMLLEESKGSSKKDNVDFFEMHGAGYTYGLRGGRFVCLKQDFEAITQHFFYVLTQPTFPKAAFEKLKKITVEGLRRAQDSAKEVGRRMLKSAMYPNHPYAWTLDEALKVVEQATLADVQKLYAEYVCPANMVLSVVGDFDESGVQALLEKSCTGWHLGLRKNVQIPAASKQLPMQIDHTMMRDQVMLYLGKQSPVTIKDEDYVPLQLLSTICFDSLGSRIYKVREQTGLFYSAGGTFAANATREHGFDYMAMLVSPENVVLAEQKLHEFMAMIVRDGLTQEELEEARIIYLKGLIDVISSPSVVAATFCSLDSLGLGFDYYDTVLQRVQKYSLDELNALARKHINTKDMTRIRVGPTSLMSDNKPSVQIQ